MLQTKLFALLVMLLIGRPPYNGLEQMTAFIMSKCSAFVWRRPPHGKSVPVRPVSARAARHSLCEESCGGKVREYCEKASCASHGGVVPLKLILSME